MSAAAQADAMVRRLSVPAANKDLLLMERCQAMRDALQEKDLAVEGRMFTIPSLRQFLILIFHYMRTPRIQLLQFTLFAPADVAFPSIFLIPSHRPCAL